MARITKNLKSTDLNESLNTWKEERAIDSNFIWPAFLASPRSRLVNYERTESISDRMHEFRDHRRSEERAWALMVTRFDPTERIKPESRSSGVKRPVDLVSISQLIRTKLDYKYLTPLIEEESSSRDQTLQISSFLSFTVFFTSLSLCHLSFSLFSFLFSLFFFLVRLYARRFVFEEQDDSRIVEELVRKKRGSIVKHDIRLGRRRRLTWPRCEPLTSMVLPLSVSSAP